MRRMSACRQLLIGMSIRRYFPPIGTAGLDRWWVSGNKRDPWPPPRMSASASLFTGIRLPTAYTTRLTCNTAVTRRRERSATILRSMNFRLIPREEKFYTDFQALGDELKRGARLLEEMLAPDQPLWDKADEIKEVEHKCDFLTHEIIQRLNRTFVTPIDREDIHALARSLDDVMDAIDASATLVRLYRLDRVRPGARELALIISACTREVRLALEALEQVKGVGAHAVE